MARYEVHQSDANAESLYKDARKLGFSVEKLNRPVDSAWGIYDQSVLVEVKTATGKLEPAQERFFHTFKGMKRIVRHTGDVIDLYREMRERHDRLFGELQQHRTPTIPLAGEAVRLVFAERVQGIGSTSPKERGKRGKEGSQDAEGTQATQAGAGKDGAVKEARSANSASAAFSGASGDGASSQRAARSSVRKHR